MANTMTNQYLENNKQYASGQTVHKPSYPGKQPINPAKPKTGSPTKVNRKPLR